MAVNEHQLADLVRAWTRIALASPFNRFLLQHAVDMWWQLVEWELMRNRSQTSVGPEIELENYRRLIKPTQPPRKPASRS